jgi:hypothetical protein
MFKLTLTTAFVAVSITLAMPGVAIASPEDDFRDRCVEAGGTFSNGTCKYPDGSTEQCEFGEDDWACYRDTPPKPTLIKNFGKLVNIPVKIVKTPIPPGPVEKSATIRTVKPSHSVKTESFTMKSETIAPSAKLEFSAKTTTLKLRKN